MTATLTRPAWTTDLEVQIFNKLIDKHAPHLTNKRKPSELWHSGGTEISNLATVAKV